MTTDTSTVTAFAYDYRFKRIFSRQIEGLVKKGDLFSQLAQVAIQKTWSKLLKYARKNLELLKCTSDRGPLGQRWWNGCKDRRSVDRYRFKQHNQNTGNSYYGRPHDL